MGTGVSARRSLCFLGVDEKRLNLLLLFVWTFSKGMGAGVGGGRGGGAARALNCVMIWGSRRTLMVSVNSSLLCSILEKSES